MKERLRTVSGLLRVHEWVKNALVFAPLVFSGHLIDRGGQPEPQFLHRLSIDILLCVIFNGDDNGRLFKHHALTHRAEAAVDH